MSRSSGAIIIRGLSIRRGTPQTVKDINRHDVIQFDGPIADHTAARWMKKIAPHAHVAARCTSTPALVLAVRSGAGLSPLPIICGTGYRRPCAGV